VKSKPRKLARGLSCRVEKIVPFDWTIAHYDAKLPPVLSTPAMIGMMEVAAAKAIQPTLRRGAISVGTRIEVDHLEAVPAGAKVSASARLTHINGRFLEFAVEARSGGHVIGRGKVFRAVVEPQKFHSRAKTRTRK